MISDVFFAKYVNDTYRLNNKMLTCVHH